MSRATFMMHVCECKDPSSHIIWWETKCPACGRKNKIFGGVFCKKCGGMIPSEVKIYKDQEIRCEHTLAEYLEGLLKAKKIG